MSLEELLRAAAPGPGVTLTLTAGNHADSDGFSACVYRHPINGQNPYAQRRGGDAVDVLRATLIEFLRLCDDQARRYAAAPKIGEPSPEDVLG